MENGADINTVDSDGNTALILATLKGIHRNVKFLVEKQPSIQYHGQLAHANNPMRNVYCTFSCIFAHFVYTSSVQ